MAVGGDSRIKSEEAAVSSDDGISRNGYPFRRCVMFGWNLISSYPCNFSPNDNDIQAGAQRQQGGASSFLIKDILFQRPRVSLRTKLKLFSRHLHMRVIWIGSSLKEMVRQSTQKEHLEHSTFCPCGLVSNKLTQREVRFEVYRLKENSQTN